MKKLLLPIFLFSVFEATAQKSVPIRSYTKAIHFSPLALLQVDYTLMAGGEYRLRPNFGFVMEAGYILASNYLNGFDSQKSSSGFIIRPSLRWYVGNKKLFYLQPQIFYKLVTHKQNDWLGKDCVEGVSTYEELTEFKYRRNIWGLNAIAGRLVPLGKSGKHFVDFYLGIGYKYKKAVIAGQENCCYIPDNILTLGRDPDQGFYPNLPGGVKLIFSIQ